MKLQAVVTMYFDLKWLPVILLLALPIAAPAQFNFTTNSNGSLNLASYTGSDASVQIPDTTNGLPVTSIGNSAFYGSSLANVTFGTNVVSIGFAAFYNCGNLTNVTIGGSVAKIGVDAFYNCTNLAGVSIPASVTNIANFAFYGCANLTAFIVDPGNPVYSSSNGILFSQDQTTLILCPGGLTGNYSIPGSVTNIQDEAFESSLLSGITIPNTVVAIGQGAFADSKILTAMIIPSSVTSIGFYTFSGCAGLTNVAIPSSVTSIQDGAFASCTNLATMTIPAGVGSLGSAVFAFCTSLVGVYFQGNAPAADSTVFSGDSGVVNYVLPGATGWGATFSGFPVVVLPGGAPAQVGFGSLGVRTNQFGFNILGTSNLVVIVDGATDLASPAWIPLGTNTLNNFTGTNAASYFSDPAWTNYPARFYRLRSQ